MRVFPISPGVGRLPTAVLPALLLAAGCATPVTRVGLFDVERRQLHGVMPVASILRQEAGVTIQPSNLGSIALGGVIGAIVDVVVEENRLKDAEEEVAPLRMALFTLDPGELLGPALEKELSAVPWIAPGPVPFLRVPGDDSLRSLLEAGDRNVLLVYAAYRFGVGFGEVIVVADAWLLPKKVHPGVSPILAARYKNSFFARVFLPKRKPGGSVQEGTAKERWTADNGKLARAAVEVGMADVARMIAYDVLETPPPGNDYSRLPDGARSLAIVHPYSLASIDGFTVRQEGGRTWVRVRSGELHSLGVVPE